MGWDVFYHPSFAQELKALEPQVREGLLGSFVLLETFGPQLGRPAADTLKASRHSNMKELRVVISGEPWRVAYAFDPVRRAVILVAGSKAGQSQALFYRRLIRIADKRFDEHVRSFKK
jgi:hypothetical protein